MDIDVSKENIQPLRGGRNLMQLGTALQAQSDSDVQRQLLLQKDEHEEAIRQYQGPDPLEPWFNYIQWVEQSFPKHGHEGNIDKLIKDCLQLFEKDERYFQDRRLVKLWIKYVDCLSNPLEIYQRLYNTGIGVECSEFYRAWACYCEESGDYKKANQVYMLGLQAKAQPLDELEQAHMNFQLFFAQRMLHDDSPTKRKAASALAETRMALTSLKSFKRRNIANVPVQRVGDSVKSSLPGVVRQQAVDNRLPNSNVMVNVYEDAPSTSRGVVTAEDPGPASLVQACNVENEKEVGIWTNPKTKMVHTNVVPHQPLPFTPYEDMDDDLKLSSKHMPYCLDDLTFNVPLCVPDPADPTKIPCYNKAQVYFNDKEYSLEEIRARKYNVQKAVKTENVQVQETYKNINETLAQCSALETLANCALDSEQDHMGQLMPLTMPTLQNVTKVTNMHSPGEPKVLCNLDSKEVSELAAKKNDENEIPSSSLSDKENQVANHFNNENVGNFGKNNLMEEFNRSLMGNLLGDSVTVNTKEARWELRNIFNDNAEPSIVQPVVQQFDVPKFDIHEDRSMTMAINVKKNFDIQDARNMPEDKENANKFNAIQPNVTSQAPNVNKTMFSEEPSCTQVFNFNIKNASTPNMSQFKKPSNIDQSSKFAVPKFSIDESVIEQPDQISTKRDDCSRQTNDQHATNDNQGGGLSVIMEATREYNSKSGSSSSGQSIRTNFTGYTTNFDSVYNNHNDPNHPSTTSKRNSLSAQARLPNGQFARAYPQKREAENKMAVTPSTSVPYHSHDHQYQKPMPPNFSGYSPQRSIHYQQNYNYQQNFPNNHMMNQQQQGYGSPNPSSYQSPQHPSMQNSHEMNQVPTGFQSPTYSNQMAYHQSPVNNPGNVMMSPQQGFTGRQDFHYSNQTDRHVYVNQQHQVFQSPPHQTQFQNSVYYQRSSQPQTQNSYNQQNYHHIQSQYNNPNMYSSSGQNSNNPNFNTVQSPYRQVPKQIENQASYGMSNNQQFQIYQSPQASQNSNLRNTSMHDANMVQGYQETQGRQEMVDSLGKHERDVENTTLINNPQSKNSSSHKSPNNSVLRNVRYDQPNVKIGQKSPEVGFSNQFLNFISNRNEPKDNANTPKFTNSPSISQKMHKNLYVSSPEQAQIPPSSGLSDTDSKDGMTAQTATPIQSAKILTIDKQKDISKRQLDFEHRDRVEIQSEDSRDSVSKDSRISSVYSRQSDFQSDGYGMDIDSENSMECGAFKSSHSISMIETSDIPRPADIDFPKVIDPFNKKMLTSLLEYVKFPNKTHAEGYNEVRSIPKLQTATVISVGNSKYSIEKQLGKGNYGAVFLCLDFHSNKSVAVKYQKPSRPWEFYICQEIKARIKDPFMLPGYMEISTAFLGENASLFVSEYSRYGSLLDVANKVRIATSKCINELIVILLTSEMLSIVHYLHKAQIIHADIKPDNFLLMKIPTQEWRTPSLQLIDLGCAIDMSLFPEGTTFRELIATEGFTCTEMREGKPWTYQTDLYCLAGTIHVILMGSYMKVANRLGQWNIDKKLPRYMKNSLWDKIFTTLLNVPDCNNIPDLMELKNDVDNVLNQIDCLGSQLRNFANVLKSR
ncbi:mitotic checkpoint serine/threonine-protein kinase BUB1 beta-like [Danaus plexippus]|uniref:mitotic checkpoint serine/threonine-protein kinase BUB1 beta-like n=1 Tax=Danaus plexippus TaxID=13037 RepID=UPI002AB1A230|nr:mitotic checkpoint serine/threonine-protein kinase BUB1 beta-like [Danaus plexippus]